MKRGWSLGLVLLLGVLAGCAGVPISPINTNTSDPVTAATPMVIATSQTGGVALDKKIWVQFNTNMDATSINAASFTVDGVSGAASYDAKNHIAYFAPPNQWVANTTYSVTVNRSVRSQAGVPLAGNYSFHFTTRDTPDVSRPVPSLVPGCVDVNGPVRVLFSEAMDSATINESTVLVAGFTGSVTYDAMTKIAAFTPDTPFTAGSTYTLTVKASVAELANSSTLGQDYNFQFTVCATPPPPPPESGSFCTYTKGAYANEGAPGQVFDANFFDIFDSGLRIGDNGSGDHTALWSNNATGLAAIKSYLVSPAGAAGALTASALNATSESQTGGGNLAEQAAALTINVNFSGTVAGYPAGFGSLILQNTGFASLDGVSVATVLADANWVLANPTRSIAGVSYSDLTNILDNLNQSFDNCTASGWATTHLAAPAK